jgi:quercetin dioxygenase-like cupin family protein
MAITTRYVLVSILVLTLGSASIGFAQVATNPAQSSTRTAPATFGKGVRASDPRTPTPQFAALASGLYARTIVDTQSSKGDYSIRILSLSVSPKVTTGEARLPGAAMLSLTAGAVEYIAGDQRGKLQPGDTAAIPEGVSIRFVNSDPTRAAVLRAVVVSDS